MFPFHGKPRASYQADCTATREVLDLVGDKWSVLVIVSLADGPVRFNALRRGIDGISQRMLTRTLRGLERDGLVSRAVTPSVPPRVDYALTRLGRSLLTPVQALAGWSWKHRNELQQRRAQFDAGPRVSR